MKKGVAPDARQYPDMKGVYPDAHMIDSIGPAPAYGLWTRHARNITLKDYWILPYSHETRPEFLDEGAISQEK